MFRTFTDVTRPALAEAASPTYLNRVYICDFCSEGWSSETEVEIHRSHSHSAAISNMMRDQEKPICKMCMRQFPTAEEMLCHIKSEHLLSSENALRVERDIFICSDCGDLFFNKYLLIHHVLNTHMPKKNYIIKCPCCLKNIRLNTFWYHFLHHKLQSIAVCRICLTKFKDRLTLAKHMQSHSFIYRCDTCAYVTKKQETYNFHILNRHKKPELNIETFNNKWQKYFMPKEQKKTWQRINLMGWKGVRLTNDIRICVLCREICVDIASMKRHIMIDHMGEENTRKGHECSCGMVFTSKVLHKHHMFKFKDEHHFIEN